MKILVCGSEGSLMQAVIPKLLALNYEVVGVDNLSRYGSRGTVKGYKFYKADLCDRFKTQKIFETELPDYVIQGAATIFGVGGFNNYCADILTKDVQLHINVLDACIARGVNRIIYISSSMVYESCKKRLPVTEDLPDQYPAPLTEYGLSKFTCERMCKAFNTQHGLSYTIWRPFNIITPHEIANDENPIGTNHVFADFINNLLINNMNPLPILGDGSQVRCFTYIDDVARAIAEHSFSGETENDIFNLGNKEPFTMNKLAKLIYDIGNQKGIISNKNPLEFKTIHSYPNDVKYRVPDSRKAKEMLNWEPTITTKQSLEICIDHIIGAKV